MNSDIVPERLSNPINYKIIILIIGSIIIFQGILYFAPESQHEKIDLVLSIAALVNPLAVSIASLVVWRRYQNTRVFGRAYFSLGVGYAMVFAAEIAYVTYDLIFQIDPYPSIADVFFFALYPFTLIHLILNIKFFNPSTFRTDRNFLIGIPIGIILMHIIMSTIMMQENPTENYESFDFQYGLIFTIMSGVTLAFTISAARIFRQGTLGSIWLLLVVGILLNTVGDIWYYNLEIFGQYDLAHPVNVFWNVSYWLIVYALIKHKKTI